MAKMRIGRTSPLTTDPKTGARIADPELFGVTLKSGGTVSSWPEVRKMYEEGKLDRDFKGKSIVNPQIKNYLDRKTDKLSDIEFEEPIIYKNWKDSNLDEYTAVSSDYKPGGKMYKALDKIHRSFYTSGKNYKNYKDELFKGGHIPQYASNETLNSSMYGAGEGEDLNLYRRTSKNAAVSGPKTVNPSITKEDTSLPSSMPILKAKVKSTPKKLSLPKKEELEKPTYELPTRSSGTTRTDKKGFGTLLKKAGNKIHRAITGDAIGPFHYSQKDYSASENIPKKDLKRFVAKFGAPSSVGGSDLSNMMPYEMVTEIQDLRDTKKRIKTNPDFKEFKKEELKNINSDIKKTKKALKYDRRADSQLTPRQGSDYNEYSYNLKRYNSSLNNAANRNTIESQLQKLKK